MSGEQANDDRGNIERISREYRAYMLSTVHSLWIQSAFTVQSECIQILSGWLLMLEAGS